MPEQSIQTRVTILEKKVDLLIKEYNQQILRPELELLIAEIESDEE